MRIVYLGFDFFANCLEALIAQGHTIDQIYSWKGDGKYNFSDQVVEIAEINKISLSFEKPTYGQLEAHFKSGSEILVSAAYPYRIPVKKEMILRGVNVHPTLLPFGRGPWPQPWLIQKYPRYAGVTVHKISADFDAGDIILQKKLPIAADERVETLESKERMLASELLQKIFGSGDFEKWWKKAKPQGKGSYWPMPKDEEYVIDWSWPVEKIDRLVRSYGRFGSEATVEAQKLCVEEVSVWKAKHKWACGTIVLKTRTEMTVAARDGFVCLRRFTKV